MNLADLIIAATVHCLSLIDDYNVTAFRNVYDMRQIKKAGFNKSTR